MADAQQILTTIDDYLLSLADGIALAQSSLSRTAAAGPPGRQFHYYLPKVDFELRMTIQVVEDQTLDARYAQVRPDTEPRVGKHLVFEPVSPARQASGSFSAEIVSTISGSFVAVPANDGLPAVLLASQLDATDRTAVQVTVTARNAAGEPVRDLEIQFNLDRDETAQLSAEAGVTASPLIHGDTYVERGVVRTDASGRAGTVLRVAPGQVAGSRLALVLDGAGRTEIIVYEVPA